MRMLGRPYLVLVSLAFACGGATHAPRAASTNVSPAAASNLRLPKDVVPTSYAVDLAIDPSRDDFAGTVTMTVMVEKPTRSIRLHAVGLEIGRAQLHRDGRKDIARVTSVPIDMVELQVDEELTAGALTVVLEYRGKFDVTSTTGAFKQTVAGKSYVFTQLEALYARRVFPCFDEPALKVPWQLTLDVPPDLVAVSNTPVLEESTLANGWRRVVFAKTKPMPSYLVAFGVGPFDVVDAGKSKRGTPVRVVTLAGRAADAKLAASTSARLLDLAEDWFGTPYPYEKLDMLTIPLTVGFGAMENVGLITFVENLMLHDATSSQERKQAWIVVAAHEIAHQWFGNLVTMEFWDDIWLNEGFANWVQYKIGAALAPELGLHGKVLDSKHYALDADALVSARKIRQPIVDNDDILTAFDGITYSKGAAVLAMFERHVGPEVFQRGVRNYLEERAWGNATSTHFAAAIATAAGNPRIADAFASFLDQQGAPEVTASIACDGAPRVEITQRRYVPPGAPAAKAERPWILPICVVFESRAGREEACGIVDAPTGSIALPAGRCPRWVMPNVEGAGYFRTSYRAPDVATLRDVAWPVLSGAERRSIAFDAQAQARAGSLPLAVALSLTPKLLAAGDRGSVELALALPQGLDAFVPDALRAKYEHWMRTTFGPGARQVGLAPVAGEAIDVEVSRSALVRAVGWTAREPELVDQARAAAARWRELPEAIRGLVLAIAADADPAVFDRVLVDVAAEPVRKRRREMLNALSGVRDVVRQNRALALTIDARIDARESIGMLRAATRDDTRTNAQAFYRANRETILARMPKDSTTDSIAHLSYVFTVSCSASDRDDIAAFVTKEFRNYGGGSRIVPQAIESMDQCIARRRLLGPEIEAWLGGVRLPKPPS